MKGAGSQVVGRGPGRASCLGEAVREGAQPRDAGAWSQNGARACAEVASSPTAPQAQTPVTKSAEPGRQEKDTNPQG